MGEDGVVVILGVRRVDGDERRLTQIGALAQRREFRLFRLGEDCGGKVRRDAVIGQRDGGKGVLVVNMPCDRAHAPFLWTIAAGVFGFDPDEIAVLGAAFVAIVDGEVVARAPLHRLGDAAAPFFVKDGEEPVCAFADGLDDIGVVTVIACGKEPCQETVANAGRRFHFGGAPRR